MPDELWDTVERLVGWLDGARTLPEETEKILRMAPYSASDTYSRVPCGWNPTRS
ncbi:hypothetical protein P3T36_002796 [Kitasatospora sp. MAP12-15]|nr:hypothetical protein [Kitasatospora sp. MAP12-44]